jgi:hypothetical protein
VKKNAVCSIEGDAGYGYKVYPRTKVDEKDARENKYILNF